MNILVLSDTHGSYHHALKAIEHAGTADYIIHLGDSADDACMIENCIGQAVVRVAGNCDPYDSSPREIQRTIAGKNFLITHGDAYQVKAGLNRLLRHAHRKKAHIVLYGHTHRAAIDTIGGIFFVNPGCFDKNGNGSYAMIRIVSGIITAEIVTISL